MIIVKSYGVLNHWVVEASCVHGVEPTASHLVYREQVRAVLPTAGDQWTAVAETLARVSRLIHQGELDTYDDCPL